MQGFDDFDWRSAPACHLGTGLGTRYLYTFWYALSILLGSERGDIAPVRQIEQAHL